jgi:hypothetical protein
VVHSRYDIAGDHRDNATLRIDHRDPHEPRRHSVLFLHAGPTPDEQRSKPVPHVPVGRPIQCFPVLKIPDEINPLLVVAQELTDSR